MKEIPVILLFLIGGYLFSTPRVILKLDDLLLHESKCSGYQTMDYLIEKGVKFSFGAVANHMNRNSLSTLTNYLNARNDKGDRLFEVWHHGYDHVIPEFEQRSYAYQKDHFHKADSMFRTMLKLQITTFGAPGNANDRITNLVLEEHPFYHVCFYFKNIPEGGNNNMFYAWNRVEIESGTGNVDYQLFLKKYQQLKNIYTDYITLQAHPNNWDENKLQEFKHIVEYLLADGAEFVLPFDYFCEKRFDKLIELKSDSIDVNSVNLSWKDPNMIEGVEYQIERSEDLKHWTKIGSVSVVNSQDSIGRRFADDNVTQNETGLYYYRVGPNAGLNKNWSNVVKVVGHTYTLNREISLAQKLNVSPNPVVDEVRFKIILEKSTMIYLDMYDINGKKVERLYAGMGEVGNNNIVVDLSHVQKGIYLVNFIQNNELTRKVRLVKL